MYIYLASHPSSFFSLEANLRLFFSGNYGGALGANALAKGLEGNKSLRVHLVLLIFYVRCQESYQFCVNLIIHVEIEAEFVAFLRSSCY